MSRKGNRNPPRRESLTEGETPRADPAKAYAPLPAQADLTGPKLVEQQLEAALATVTRLRDEKEQLRRQFEEAQQIVEAIRQGDVDALVVTGPKGEQVYALAGAEHAYRVIVETMHEAALTVDPDGTILFCNQRFCDVMKTAIPGAMGHKVTTFVAKPQWASLEALLVAAQTQAVQRRLTLRATDGTIVPVQLSASPLDVGDGHSICLVVSDLTELEKSAHSLRVLREHEQAMQEANARLQAQSEELQSQAEELRAHAEELAAAHATLWESGERLALAASGTRIGMYERNVATGVSLWTEQVARLLGLRAQQQQQQHSPQNIIITIGLSVSTPRICRVWRPSCAVA